jgi:DNA-binding PadR family transcriptional regulator
MAPSAKSSGPRARRDSSKLSSSKKGSAKPARAAAVLGGGGSGRGPRPRAGDVRPLTNRQWAVLVLLMGRFGDPLNAYAIAKAMRGREGTPGFVEGSIYREIDRLLLSGHIEEEEIVTPRGRLRGYVLSKNGFEAVRGWARTRAAIPIEVGREAWLRVASIESCSRKDVCYALSGLAEELDGRMDELELKARIARRTGEWTVAVQLSFALEREALAASRRWVGEATVLLGASEGAIAS